MRNDWEKMDVRAIWKLAKCGDGLHLRVPKSVRDAFELESGDEIRVELAEVRRARVRA